MTDSLDVVLTTLQNGVSAINNLGNQISVSCLSGPYLPWTPTVSSGTGTFTTVSSAGRYRVVGSTVLVAFGVNITTNGTSSGYVRVSLPVPSAATSIVEGRENNVTGKLLQGRVDSNSAVLVNYDNTYPGGDGFGLIFSGTYEAA